MIKRTIGITCAVGLLALGLPACSSAEDPPGTGGTSSSGGSGAGTPSTGGSGAGTAGTPGTGGTGTGGTGTGGTGTGGANPGCTGIRSNMACPTEGLACPDLKCGLCDSGTRACNCTNLTWICEPCNFANSEFMTAPTAPETCGSQTDELACPGMMGSVCTGAMGGEVCGCCNPANFPDGEVWDCDSPPSTWP